MSRAIAISMLLLLVGCGDDDAPGRADAGPVADAAPRPDAGMLPDAAPTADAADADGAAPGMLQFGIQLDVEGMVEPRLHGFAIDPLSGGDLLAVGDFEGTVVFEPGTAREIAHQSAGSLDAFVARYRGTDGALVWATVIGGDGIDVMGAAAALDDGGAVVGMRLEGEVVLNAGQPGAVTVSGAFDTSHLVRYRADGSLVWATRIGGEVGGLAEAPDGSIVATGRFGTRAVFGEGEPNETVLQGTPVGATFFARFDPDGTLAWARAVGPAGGRGAVALADGSAVFAGLLRFESVFGPGEPNETTLSAGGAPDIFFARYQPNGSLAWARQLVGQGQEFPTGLATHGDDLFLAGETGSPLIFGRGEANETRFDPMAFGGVNTVAGFVARYDTDGRLDWVEGLYPTSANSGVFEPDVAAIAGGGVALSASFSGTVRVSDRMTLSSTGARDLFVARYEADRATAWIRQLRGNESIENAGVVQLTNGAICVAGGFDGTVELGDAMSESLTARGTQDLFVACYEP